MQIVDLKWVTYKMSTLYGDVLILRETWASTKNVTESAITTNTENFIATFTILFQK